MGSKQSTAQAPPEEDVLPVTFGDTSLKLYLPKVNHGTNQTGLRLWVGGLLLAAYLAEDEGSRMLKGRSVVELGCGVTAVPTLAAAASLKRMGCGAGQNIVATDYCQSIVDVAKANIALNQVAATTQVLDWESPGSRQWEVVLFADCVYSEEVAELLANAIDAVLAPNGEVVGILPPLRVGIMEFVRKMEARGLVAQELPINDALKQAVDAGSMLPDGAEDVSEIIHGRPASSCMMVRWRRRPEAAGMRDETDRIWDVLATRYAVAESNIKLSEGFEIWE